MDCPLLEKQKKKKKKKKKKTSESTLKTNKWKILKLLVKK